MWRALWRPSSANASEAEIWSRRGPISQFVPLPDVTTITWPLHDARRHPFFDSQRPSSGLKGTINCNTMHNSESELANLRAELSGTSREAGKARALTQRRGQRQFPELCPLGFTMGRAVFYVVSCSFVLLSSVYNSACRSHCHPIAPQLTSITPNSFPPHSRAFTFPSSDQTLYPHIDPIITTFPSHTSPINKPGLLLPRKISVRHINTIKQHLEQPHRCATTITARFHSDYAHAGPSKADWPSTLGLPVSPNQSSLYTLKNTPSSAKPCFPLESNSSWLISVPQLCLTTCACAVTEYTSI